MTQYSPAGIRYQIRPLNEQLSTDVERGKKLVKRNSKYIYIERERESVPHKKLRANEAG